jgi:hypothetical protein
VRRHRFDPISALFGATFAAVGLAFLLGTSLTQVRNVFWPAVALIAGTTFVAWATMVALHDRRRAVVAEAPAEPTAHDEPDGPASQS